MTTDKSASDGGAAAAAEERRRAASGKVALRLEPLPVGQGLTTRQYPPEYGIRISATSVPAGFAVGELHANREELAHGREGHVRRTNIGRGWRSADVSPDGTKVLCCAVAWSGIGALPKPGVGAATLFEVGMEDGEITILWNDVLPTEYPDPAMNAFYVGGDRIAINTGGSLLLMRRSGGGLSKITELAIDGKEACHSVLPLNGGAIVFGESQRLFHLFGICGDEVALLAKQKAKQGYLILQSDKGVPFYRHLGRDSRILGVAALYERRFGVPLSGWQE